MSENTKSQYKTAPDPNETGWPAGVPYIIGNEGCERFSFYGMRSILQVHLTILFVLNTDLMDGSYEEIKAAVDAGATGLEAAKNSAQEMYHTFVMGVYLLPMVGALIADRLWGKYNTILWLSLVYCAGHAVLAVGENSITGMYIGLGLIALGSGGIKPCVSANVGDQFGKGNSHLVEKVFQAFYFIINFGSFFATLLIPVLLAKVGAWLAFGLPGVLMFVATVVFWMGRDKFVHIPPKPAGKLGWLDVLAGSLLFGFIAVWLFFGGSILMRVGVSLAFLVAGFAVFGYRQSIEEDDGFLAVAWVAARKGMSGARAHFTDPETVEGAIAVVRIMSIFILVSMFWALFDQHGSSWVRQAQSMNLHVNFIVWEGDLLPSQIGAMNPLMVMGLIPFVSFFMYPTITKMGFAMTPLRRMSMGMFMAGLAYVAIAMIQDRIDVEGHGQVSVAWQIVPYLIITLSEVMVSITGLEFAYTQAPKRMKSIIMGFWLLTVALGNKIVALLSTLPDMSLAESFWLYSGMMAAAAVVFSIAAFFYKGKTYTN